MVSEYNLEYDGYVTINSSIPEKCIHNGHAYRAGTGIVSLTAGQYASINFVTPSTGYAFYTLSTIDKTGDELSVTLIQGDTYTGGTTANAKNLNCIVGETDMPFTFKTGGSTSGGSSFPERLISGLSQGNSKSGGSSEISGSIILKQGTSYTLKITSIGSAKLSALFTLSYHLKK